MRSKRNKKSKKKKISILPASAGLCVPVILCFLALVVFIGLLAVVNVLPEGLVLITLGILVLIIAGILALLNSKKKKTIKRKLGVLLALLLTIGLGLGTYYLYSTYTVFNKISEVGTQTEDFHVVVLTEGSYETVDDIENKEVYVTASKSDSYKEAKGILMSKAGVSYKEKEEYLELGYMLVDDKGETHDNIIFLNDMSYQILCEEVDGFQKEAKILDTISIEMESEDIAKRADVTREPFNVYISGVDTYGSINTVARSDVNMIMTVNPVTKEILLTSIPRDMYLPLHTYQANDKLTHSGIYGVNETIMTVEDWLDIDINYYIRVNFTTLVDVVDVIGGIDVESEYAFSSSAADYSYVAGTNHLNGKAALYFARERKSLSGGDNERVLNQQRVLKGIITKITSSPVVLTKYTQLLTAIGDKMQTNLSDRDISALVKAQLDDLGGWTIESNAIDGKGTEGTTYSMGSRPLYIQIPVEESVIEAQKQISKVMYPVDEEQ